MSDRIPPYSEEAEKSTLGAMLLDPVRMVSLVRSKMKLKPDCFYVPANQLVCEAIFACMEKEQHVDSLLAGEYLKSIAKLEQAGGFKYLDDLIEKTPTAEHGEYYADIVRQKFILRQTIYLAREIEVEAHKAERGDEHVATIPGRFVSIIGEVTEEVSNKTLLDKSLEVWRAGNDLLAKQENRTRTSAMGLPTPFKGLTDLTCGFETGITIIAGRPSEGKTTLEDQVCCHLAAKGIPVARVSMDMTAKRLLQRAACRKAGVSLPKLKSGFATLKQLNDVATANEEIAQWPMYINDWDRDIDSICAWIRAQKVKHDIQLVTLDFMTCISYWAAKGNWNQNAVVSHISGELKRLSLTLDIPVVPLSQLNRAPSKDDDRPPKLTDLRDSGALEQDAAKVISVYRDLKVVNEMEKETPGSTKNQRPTWVEVLKNQDGECGKIPYWMKAHYFLFDECEGFEQWQTKKEAGAKGALRQGSGQAKGAKKQDADPDGLGVEPWKQEFEGLVGGEEMQ